MSSTIVMRSSVIFLLSVVLLSGTERQGPRLSGDPLGGHGPRPALRIGDYPFPTNPMNDRAKGFLIQGKVKNAVSNYGNFINWDEHPSGLWGDYSYLPAVSFLAGVPGQAYSSRFEWTKYATTESGGVVIRQTWESSDAYEAWFEDGDTNFVGIVFDAEDDAGTWDPDSIAKKSSIDDISDSYQWGIDSEQGTIFISVEGENDPNKSTAKIGLIRPWALRPKLKNRADDFDVYEYGDDLEEWTADDIYFYYGAAVSESWFTRWGPSTNTDWHASTNARINTHATEVTAGDIFSDTPFTDAGDTYPLLAHSSYSQTWPMEFSDETGDYEPFWPGWWAEDYWGDKPELWEEEGITNCSGSRKDPDCWKVVPGRFISDTDVYMEFDDRWTHRANMVDTNDEYEQTGYPLGLRVMAEAHSYGVSYAEDIMFVTVRVRNESGDWFAFERDISGNQIPILDKDGMQLSGDGIIMPDGTKLNRGRGFDYKDITLGFYMDADAAMGDINGYSGAIHTNADDFMEYIDCLTSPEFFPDGCPEVGGEVLRISMALIYDYDGISGPATDLGLVATQLLDSPLATDEIDLDQDGFADIYPGEPLKMTDWHWFDWYNRPGVVNREGDNNCCAGDLGRPVAKNREEILLKVIQGDTVNLSENEHAWFFHTANPDMDLGSELNPHFDSLEGLEREDAFLSGDEGLDCVLIMSCGPFDMAVGEEAPFSFCIIFGEDYEDLIQNATFAQIMYNSHYQGYTPPSKPTVYTEIDHGQVTLYWDDIAESSKDVVTSYADFEGYKIYRSRDGGNTWGSNDKRIYDNSDVLVGWRPYAQFDLSAEEDSVHCIYENDECDAGENRGRSIKGSDPHVPWFNLGSDTGFDEIRLPQPVEFDGKEYTYVFVDSNVIDGMEYTYSVTAYDMGVEAPFVVDWVPDGSGGFLPDTIPGYANPDNWSAPDGYEFIENSKGTTVLDANFVKVHPGSPPQDDLTKIKVVPNPYIQRSGFSETEYLRQIRFTNLPEQCTITVFTVTGERVTTLEHSDPDNGNHVWDMRTVNNQEISPGLYIFAVESGSKTHIGKFAVVR